MAPTISADQVALKALLDRLSFLQKLAQDEISYILSGAVAERTFHAGQFLYAQDEPVRFVYLLLEGSVEEMRSTREPSGRTRQTLKRTIGPGARLGLYDFLAKHDHSTRARTLEAGRLLAIRATALERLIYRFPNVRSSLAPLQKIDRLRTMPFLADLDWIALGFVADAASDKVEYKPKAEIYTTAAAAEQIYLIDQGQVQLTWPDHATLLLGNGAVCGIIQPDVQQAGPNDQCDHTATAVVATALYAIPRRNLHDIMGSNPDQQGLSLIHI